MPVCILVLISLFSREGQNEKNEVTTKLLGSGDCLNVLYVIAGLCLSIFSHLEMLLKLFCRSLLPYCIIMMGTSNCEMHIAICFESFVFIMQLRILKYLKLILMVVNNVFYASLNVNFV